MDKHATTDTTLDIAKLDGLVTEFIDHLDLDPPEIIIQRCVSLINAATSIQQPTKMSSDMSRRFDQHDKALTEATEYELAISQLPDDLRDGTPNLRAIAPMTLYLYRAQCASRLGNWQLASLMMDRATSENLTTQATHKELDLVCYTCLETGMALLYNDEGGKAVYWLKKCYLTLESMGVLQNPAYAQIKQLTPIVLANAYLKHGAQDKESLQFASNITNILLEDNPEDPTCYILKTKLIMHQQNDPDHGRDLGLKVLNECMEQCKPTHSEGLLEVIVYAHGSFGICNALDLYQTFFRSNKYIGEEAEFGEIIEEILLSRCHFLTKATMVEEASVEFFERRQAAFQDLKLLEPRISHKNASACLLIMWREGDKLLLQSRYKGAAEWFLASTTLSIFQKTADGNKARTFRKLGYTYLQMDDMSKAEEAIIQSLEYEDHAMSHYIRFAINVELGNEQDALALLDEICNSSTFTLDILTSAAKLCQERRDKPMLIRVLHRFHYIIAADNNCDPREYLVVLRCLSRLLTDRLDKEAFNLDTVTTMFGYLSSALSFMTDLDLSEPALAKEHEWFCWHGWKIGKSCLDDWNERTMAHKFMYCTYELCSLIKQDNKSLRKLHADSLFLAISLRDAGSRPPSEYQQMQTDINQCHTLLLSLQPSSKTISASGRKDVQLKLRALNSKQFELHLARGDIDAAIDMVKAAVKDRELQEHYAYFILKRHSFPPEVVLKTVGNILDSMFEDSFMDIRRYSYWMHILIRTALDANMAEFGFRYITQVMDCLQNAARKAQYPPDQLQYLSVTAYNYAVDLFYVHDTHSAKLWCEAALRLAPFTNLGAENENEMRRTYKLMSSM
ncbi:hypothetical protein BZG36_02611 [Bifiguratus adelaidae]|uniref:Protein ZIP4 homolog n=1 Tax=Bifiguratus adelaidae TaxID=1938954 RepID=A0A261Y2L3_9FUNG|nr:hypothetical protein BZG36_02611 [Bifiguratus adelaidae]